MKYSINYVIRRGKGRLGIRMMLKLASPNQLYYASFHIIMTGLPSSVLGLSPSSFRSDVASDEAVSTKPSMCELRSLSTSSKHSSLFSRVHNIRVFFHSSRWSWVFKCLSYFDMNSKAFAQIKQQMPFYFSST